MMPVTNPAPMVDLRDTQEVLQVIRKAFQGLREKMRVVSAWVPIVH